MSGERPSAVTTFGARALGGLKWGGTGTVASALLQLIFTAAMARLLVPADFGLMAMCAVALRFFAYFAQLGMAAALVQRQRLTPEDVRCALGLTWLVCGATVLLVMAAAPLLGWFFRNEEVVLLGRVLAPSLLVQGLGGVSMALLRRAMRFRAQAMVEVASYAVGFGVVGVAAAWAGAGVWSLVAATHAQAAFTAAMAWAFTRHPLRPSWRGDRRGLLGYGARHSVISFLEFVSGTLDAAVIGRLLGEVPLGLYNRALVLTNQPVERVSGMIARVLFPVLSAMQGERRHVGSAYLLGLSVVGVFGGAVSLGLAAAAGDVVRVLLGPSWDGAVPVVRVLALSVPFLFMSQISGSVCDAMALLGFKLRVQALGLVVIASLMFALYPLGVTGIAWAVVLGEALRFLAFMVFLPRELECARGDLARSLAGVAASSALAFGACAGAAGLARLWLLAPFAALALELLSGLLALALGAWFTLWLLDGRAPIQLAAASLPGWQRLRARLGFSGALA